jgi:hypothetical protein
VLIAGFLQAPVKVEDSIVYGNTAGPNAIPTNPWNVQIDDSAMPAPLPPDVDFSDVQDGSLGAPWFPPPVGIGNIDARPRLQSGPATAMLPDGDFYLRQNPPQSGPTSPCVNAGSGSVAGTAVQGRTTRTDQFDDLGILDIGFHYPGLIPIP